MYHMHLLSAIDRLVKLRFQAGMHARGMGEGWQTGGGGSTCSRILRAGMERLPEEGGGAVTMVTPKASPLKASLTLGSMPNKSSAVMMPPAALQQQSTAWQNRTFS